MYSKTRPLDLNMYTVHCTYFGNRRYRLWIYVETKISHGVREASYPQFKDSVLNITFVLNNSATDNARNTNIFLANEFFQISPDNKASFL